MLLRNGRYQVPLRMAHGPVSVYDVCAALLGESFNHGQLACSHASLRHLTSRQAFTAAFALPWRDIPGTEVAEVAVMDAPHRMLPETGCYQVVAGMDARPIDASRKRT